MRERYAFWAAAAVTGVLALVWSVSLQYRLDDSFTSGEFVEGEHSGAFANFLGDARRNFANVISSVKEETPQPAAAPAATSTEEEPALMPFTLSSSTRQTVDIEEEKPVRIATTTRDGGRDE